MSLFLICTVPCIFFIICVVFTYIRDCTYYPIVIPSGSWPLEHAKYKKGHFRCTLYHKNYTYKRNNGKILAQHEIKNFKTVSFIGNFEGLNIISEKSWGLACKPTRENYDQYNDGNPVMPCLSQHNNTPKNQYFLASGWKFLWDIEPQFMKSALEQSFVEIMNNSKFREYKRCYKHQDIKDSLYEQAFTTSMEAYIESHNIQGVKYNIVIYSTLGCVPTFGIMDVESLSMLCPYIFNKD